jgi:type IV secretory pathway VirJ component
MIPLVAGAFALGTPAWRQVALPLPAVAEDSIGVGNLPVSAIPSKVDGRYLAIMITGDGGFVAADRALAKELAAAGVPVAVLNARAYLSKKRTPDEAARDVGRIADAFLARWHRENIVLVGYSRGADIMPFVANRLPEPTRARVDLIALLGPAARAGFEFHWRDMLFDTPRATDLPVLPEIERLRGTRMLCVYGDDEHDPLCKTLDTSLVTVVARDGKHRISGRNAPELARIILTALP